MYLLIFFLKNRNNRVSPLSFIDNLLTHCADIFLLDRHQTLQYAITKLKNAGYKLVTVAECVGKSPYQSVAAPQSRTVSLPILLKPIRPNVVLIYSRIGIVETFVLQWTLVIYPLRTIFYGVY
jgi:hypothetical protein